MTPSNLRAAREQLGFSQATMAKMIGRSVRQYKAYELGEVEIPLVAAKAVEMVQSEHKQTTTGE